MNESIAIVVFVLIMMYVEIKDTKKIIIKARVNYIRMAIAVIIAIAAAIIFWPNNLPQQIELVTISSLILFFGFIPEGLGQKQVVKIGTLDGDYNKFKKIELEDGDRKSRYTRVSFYLRKNNSTSIVVIGNKGKVFSYLQQVVPDKGKVQFR